MTDKEIEKIREAMGSLPVDLMAFEVSQDTPPEQRIDEAMRCDGEAIVQCVGSVVSLIDPARVKQPDAETQHDCKRSRDCAVYKYRGQEWAQDRCTECPHNYPAN